MPTYRAFISRSNRDEDKPIVEPIISFVQLWGFKTYTVGINVFENNPDNITKRIKNEIMKSDCLIGIATKSDLSALDFFVLPSAGKESTKTQGI